MNWPGSAAPRNHRTGGDEDCAGRKAAENALGVWHFVFALTSWGNARQT
jgi:hypothetical protein